MDKLLNSTVHLLNGDFTFCSIPIIDVIRSDGGDDPRDIAIIVQNCEGYGVVYATSDVKLCNCEICIQKQKESDKQWRT